VSSRHRTIAAAPERSASEAAHLAVEMITQTLASATAIGSVEVERELDAIEGLLRVLVAGEHLQHQPLTLVADPLRVEISVVAGDRALGLSEKLGKVPGAATAESWSVHLPRPEILATRIENTIDSLDHVTTDRPPAPKAARGIGGGRKEVAIDADALRKAASA
jgi:hypothetical protein